MLKRLKRFDWFCIIPKIIHSTADLEVLRNLEITSYRQVLNEVKSRELSCVEGSILSLFTSLYVEFRESFNLNIEDAQLDLAPNQKFEDFEEHFNTVAVKRDIFRRCLITCIDLNIYVVDNYVYRAIKDDWMQQAGSDDTVINIVTRIDIDECLRLYRNLI